ncbi:exonuclease domain-containing protein [Rhodococcus sp. ZPP]|uniref:exonuclease domain-containing protein n=1 Tax=Rhodococcus sp. ZPP TaxID=2749906 RepID=UPI001FCDB2D8|nr:exonuclease domain-containing protein [Rhodococcus sp. ZPP]
MSQWQGYGAMVTITGEHLVIDRSGVLSVTIGRRQVIALPDVVSYHVKQPSLLSNGWVQLCVGGPRPVLGRGVAPSDPHTVMFKRGQRQQMATLVAYLQQVVAYNQQWQRPFAAGASSPASPVAPISVPPRRAEVPVSAAPQEEPVAKAYVSPPPAVAQKVSVQVSTGPSFVGFDVETANGARGSICAIGLSVVTAGRVTATHSWLCRPPAGLDRFEPGNSRIHGLTARDVAGQPTFRQRLADMLDIVGDLPLIAHNAAFDIGALREASAAEALSWSPLTYGCTLIWSRSELPELPNHKLPTVAAALGVPLLQHHDASADATAAAEIALGLMRRRAPRPSTPLPQLPESFSAAPPSKRPPVPRPPTAPAPRRGCRQAPPRHHRHQAPTPTPNTRCSGTPWSSPGR